MKICHVIDSGGLYGAERLMIDLAVAQKRSGLEVCVVSLGSSGAGVKEVERASRAAGLSLHVVRERKFRLDLVRRKLFRLFNELGIHVVHLHGYKPCIAINLGGISRIPFIQISTLHGWGVEESWLRKLPHTILHSIALRRVDAVVAVSASVLAQRWASRTHSRPYVIKNGIVPLGPNSNAGTSSSDGNRKTILFVGRLIEAKGVFELVHAFATLQQRPQAVELWFIGDGPAMPALRDLVRQLGINMHVKFFGFQQVVEPYYRAADCLVLPSHSEGVPICVLEAMSVGTPVVASRVGGIPELLDNGKVGWLIEPLDVKQLAQTLEDVLSDSLSTEVREKAQRALAYQLRHFSVDRMATEYRNVLDEIVSGESTHISRR